jgi:chromosome segregation ATPase
LGGEAWGWAISHATTHPANPSEVPSKVASKEGHRDEHAEPVYDLDRLERAIAGLVEDNARLREAASEMRHALDERTARIVRLEGELRESNQRRQDVAKRIDELISQMDALDAQLASAETGPEAG